MEIQNLDIFKLQECSPKLWKLVIDLPGEKVNKLGRKALEQFQALLPHLEALHKEGKIDALVMLSGKPTGFIAGADISMVQNVKDAAEAEALSRAGQALLNRWEDLPFPTVMGVHGAALGGGLEFCLASTAIVASNDSSTKLGMPEVMLGFIPGTGGCLRMPRKVGLATALDMILTGKSLSGERAFRGGLVEACFPKENFEEAVLHWTKSNLAALRSGKRLAKEPKLGGMGGAIGSIMEKTPLGRKVIFRKARQGVLAKTRGKYPAPLEALDVIEAADAGYERFFRGAARDQVMAREAKGFGRVVATDVSKNLVRLFFMMEDTKKATGLAAGVKAQALEIKSAAVLGAGVMGGGIAQLFADKGVVTRLKDLNNKALALGVQAASKLFAKAMHRKRITKRQYQQKLNLIAPVLDYSGFRSTELVVEAIVENMDIKQSVLKDLESHVSETCVIATNTSSLSVTKMAAPLAHPERFVGMHFFNPVSRMPLIEVIRGEKTSDEAVTTTFQFCKKIGKTPIVVKDAPGFLVNRLLMPYLNEATYLVMEGVPIPELDEVMLDFGMPMGPMELIDEVGVDVGEKVAHILFEGFGSRMEPAPNNGKIVAAGRLGKKNGKGLYQYDKSGRNKELDPKIYEILGVTPKTGCVSKQEIVDRCVLPMINEAARCLDEAVVATPGEVDLGMIMGTGFPPFKGGLLRYADSLGVQEILDRLKKYNKRFGARFEAAPGLLRRFEQKQLFYSN
ncbi:3-hydroxyacyl-CoA dehydrogenase NAD-binding domain-containing protein [Bdellovibrionota bacterium FG-2]